MYHIIHSTWYSTSLSLMTNGKLAVSEMSELLGDDGKLDTTWLFLLNNKIVINRLHIYICYAITVFIYVSVIFLHSSTSIIRMKIIDSWLMQTILNQWTSVWYYNILSVLIEMSGKLKIIEGAWAYMKQRLATVLKGNNSLIFQQRVVSCFIYFT